MVRLYQKKLLLVLFSTVAVSSAIQAYNFQSVKNQASSCVKNLQKFTSDYALPLSLAVGTFVSGSCLMGTGNFLELTKNVVGAAPFCAYKVAEQLGPQKTLGASLAVLIGLGLKHYYSFYKIEDQLIKAEEKASDVNDPRFMFARWKTNYATYKNIIDNKDEVKKALKEIKFNDCTDHLAKISEKLKEEKELLETHIKYVGQYTDLPAQLTKESQENLKIALPDTIDSEKALVALRSLVEKNSNPDHENFEGCFKNSCQGHAGSSICYLSQWRWWNPLAISFVPCTQKATKVCMQLFNAYARVYALQNLVSEILGEKKKKESDREENLLKNPKVSIDAKWNQVVKN